MDLFHSMLFLHIISSTLMGMYLFFPFVLRRFIQIHEVSKKGFLHILYRFNRIGQYVLIVEILSGGYLYSRLHLSNTWTTLMTVFVLGVGAAAGFIGVKLKKLGKTYQSGVQSNITSVQKLAWIGSISFVIVILLMCLRNVF